MNCLVESTGSHLINSPHTCTWPRGKRNTSHASSSSLYLLLQVKFLITSLVENHSFSLFTFVLISKTKMELLDGGPVYRSLDSQHVQLLLQAGSADTMFTQHVRCVFFPPKEWNEYFKSSLWTLMAKTLKEIRHTGFFSTVFD